MGKKNPKRHLVAWVDILGLASRLEDPRELVAVANILERFIPQVLEQNNPLLEDQGQGKVAPIVEVEVFQDTIVLWTAPRWQNLEILLRACLGLMASLHAAGIPARGAVSIGTLYTSRLADVPASLPNGGAVNVVLGSGIARAAKLERKCSLAGIVVDARLTQNTEDLEDTAQLAQFLKDEGQTFCIPYRGLTFLRWPDYLPDMQPPEIMSLMWPTPPEGGRPEAIYRSTQRFIEFAKRQPGILASSMALTELVLGGPGWQVPDAKPRQRRRGVAKTHQQASRHPAHKRSGPSPPGRAEG